ncbi:threonine--tRNA ligase, partial [Francisella tularensis subsp. holarctica]|uniref:aminoacyl--tRNA ligase-related protein n=1 Tax=Francisella tularensis TaxID=263 RepID=UPI0023AC17F7|nr:threonine--tRNA ligase [Francisella tularensis subsp. holarctica]
HSYRDIPIRMDEFGIVHRNEPSGSLHGLLRVRSITQDDGHIFCTPEQVEEEVILKVQQCFEVYKDFCFNDFSVKIALRT